MNLNDLSFCQKLVRQAGTSLHSQCHSNPSVQPPSTREAAFQTFEKANKHVESFLKESLAGRFPSIHWSASEFRPEQQQQPEFRGEYWICDAIDGALHFIQGFGFYSLSLCLIRNGTPVLAIVYDPEREELFHAVTGQGAFLNDKRIQVASKTKLGDTYVTTSLPSFPAKEPECADIAIRSAARLTMKTFAVKMLGSVKLQLAYVACGRLDGYWEFGSEYGDYYDWLPGTFIVQEAGGTVTDSAGSPFTWGSRGVIASNQTLSAELIRELASV
ncbi:inositol monophosphatase [Bacillus sp. BRMEA1]|uniref:inositol monophosphatase family protein n=1 Tax=Neobacillus endophyticus TaxID=2738405 RepID=UPI001564F2A1|nr:inositol monophosphatase family protein [Neobacillus endophyticus]NRD76858.1 inositol monophosphatase [Neobacillus endophyticus]